MAHLMIRSFHEYDKERWAVTTIGQLEFLLQRNKDALHEEMTLYNSYPVYYAIICGANLDVVHWIVERTGADFVRKLKFNNNWNFLHFAAYNNFPHLIPYLLDLLGTGTLSQETEDDDCFTPLEFAKDIRCRKRKVKCIHMLSHPEETVKLYREKVENEVQYMVWDLHSKSGWSESDKSYVKKMIRMKNKQLLKDHEEQMKKARKMSSSRRLRRNMGGADGKKLRRTQSSLGSPVRKHSLQRSSKSMQNIKSGIDDTDVQTPNVLRECGGDDNEIPLYYAIRYGGMDTDLEILKMMCTETGIQFCKGYRSENGFTLMHWTICAKVGPKKEFIEWLGEEVFGDEAVKLMRMPYRAGPFLKVHENDTLLHEAAKYSRTEAIPYLLAILGLEALKFKNNDGLTPVEISKQQGCKNEDVEDLLIYPNKTIKSYRQKFEAAIKKVKAVKAFTNPFSKKAKYGK